MKTSNVENKNKREFFPEYLHRYGELKFADIHSPWIKDFYDDFKKYFNDE